MNAVGAEDEIRFYRFAGRGGERDAGIMLCMMDDLDTEPDTVGLHARYALGQYPMQVCSVQSEVRIAVGLA
jgi:hypothetical protein